MARRRLDLVADVFAEPSTAFLRKHVDFRPDLALDLGCAAGRTTHLLADVTRAELVVGLDVSESFLRTAPRAPGIAFVCADTTRQFPMREPDLVYCRLLLAHLPEPEAVIASWAPQLKAGGLLLLDEVEWIRTDNSVLARYEEVVSAMVGARGAHISVGPYIGGLRGDGWQERSSTLRRYPVAPSDAARMYAMNLATWRHDAFVADNYGDAELDELAAGLVDLARSSTADEITWGLRQVAYERVSGGR